MPKSLPRDVAAQAQALLEAWKQISAGSSFGDLTPEALEADLEQLRAVQAKLNDLEAQLTDQRNRRDDMLISIWDKVKRVRSAVKGIYGDDSSQYEMVGGTRRSERKRHSRPAA